MNEVFLLYWNQVGLFGVTGGGVPWRRANRSRSSAAQELHTPLARGILAALKQMLEESEVATFVELPDEPYAVETPPRFMLFIPALVSGMRYDSYITLEPVASRIAEQCTKACVALYDDQQTMAFAPARLC